MGRGQADQVVPEPVVTDVPARLLKVSVIGMIVSLRVLSPTYLRLVTLTVKFNKKAALAAFLFGHIFDILLYYIG